MLVLLSYSYCENGNTLNLIAHLKTNHISPYQECRQAMEEKAVVNATKELKKLKTPSTQPMLMETVAKCQPYEKKSKRHLDLTNAVTYCIAKDSLPTHIVERTGFKAMLKAFDPHYQIPGKNYFSQISLPPLYTSTKRKGSCRNTSVFLFCNH